jgi:hypothetical protein
MVKVERMKISDLTKAAPFSEYSGLISQDGTLQEKLKSYRLKIKQSMIDRGFDETKPIDIWKRYDIQKHIVVDGYTRLSIAEEVGLDEVFVALHEFGSEEEAMAYAIHNQEARRPSTDYTILIGVKMIEAYHIPKKGAPREGRGKSKTIKETATALGVNRNTVEKARTVLADAEKRGNDKPIEEIKAGKKTINSAYREAMLARLNTYHSLKLKRHITSWKDPKDRQLLAKEAQIGDGTANRFDYVSSKSPSLTAKVLSGEMTCNAAYESLRSRESPIAEKEDTIAVFKEAIKDLKCPICGGPAAACISWVCQEKA